MAIYLLFLCLVALGVFLFVSTKKQDNVLKEIHVLVNARLSLALESIEELKKTLAIQKQKTKGEEKKTEKTKAKAKK